MFFHGQFKRDFTSCDRFDFEKVSERQIMLCEFLITFYGLYPEIENVGLTQNYEFFFIISAHRFQFMSSSKIKLIICRLVQIPVAPNRSLLRL